jgi:hypothetical protein
MQAALRSSLDSEVHGRTSIRAAADDAVAAAGSGPDFEGLADAQAEAAVESPIYGVADVQLSRVQQMRLRMRRQLDAQLACTVQRRAFLMEEVDLMDAELGVGAFVNKYPPTINAGHTARARAFGYPHHTNNAAASLLSLKTRMSVSPDMEYFIVSCGKLLGCIRRNDVNSGVWQY